MLLGGCAACSTMLQEQFYLVSDNSGLTLLCFIYNEMRVKEISLINSVHLQQTLIYWAQLTMVIHRVIVRTSDGHSTWIV